MDTTTLEKHQVFTRSEMGDNPYYKQAINLLKEKGIKTMVDAGACTGEVTKVCFERIPTLESAIAIEPLEKNVEFTKENLKEYNVEVIHGALFYGPSTISLAVIGNVGGATVHHNHYHKTETSPTVQLEQLGTIDFLKLDIEGAERNIIENSTAIHDIPFIEIEFHHYDSELCHAENRIPYLTRLLPHHKVVLIGTELEKDSSLFLQKI